MASLLAPPISLDWLSFAADCLGILGFLITCWVAWSVRKIRKFYTSLARGKNVASDLRGFAKEISSFLNGSSLPADEARKTLKQCLAVLETLRMNCPGRAAKSAKKLIKAIKRQTREGSPIESAIIRSLYEDLTVVELELIEDQEDQKWRPKQ